MKISSPAENSESEIVRKVAAKKGIGNYFVSETLKYLELSLFLFSRVLGHLAIKCLLLADKISVGRSRLR